MKTFLTTFALAALILAPALAAEEAPQVVQPAEAAATVTAEAAPETACGSGLALAEAMTAPVYQAQVDAASCSTRCSDGSTLSCNSPNCFVERSCFIYCNGVIIRCNSPCP